MSNETSVWLISGCSTGFGRELAKAVLERGLRAVITARGKDRVADLAAIAPDRALALDLDVTKPSDIDHVVSETTKRFGRIDVLVNNAGYGYQSSIEEGEDEAIRDLFESNVFGLYALTRAVLPVMRQQKSGSILSISSMAGFVGFPGSGYYAATKHAVEGFTDALAAEVEPLGIHAGCVEPGPFRTDWAGRSLQQNTSKIADYAETVAKRMKATADISGSQAGDPVRAAHAMIDAVEGGKPPRHLVLGAIAINGVTQKLKERLDEIETWRKVGEDTDYPKN